MQALHTPRQALRPVRHIRRCAEAVTIACAIEHCMRGVWGCCTHGRPAHPLPPRPMGQAWAQAHHVGEAPRLIHVVVPALLHGLKHLRACMHASAPATRMRHAEGHAAGSGHHTWSTHGVHFLLRELPRSHEQHEMIPHCPPSTHLLCFRLSGRAMGVWPQWRCLTLLHTAAAQTRSCSNVQRTPPGGNPHECHFGREASQSACFHASTCCCLLGLGAIVVQCTAAANASGGLCGGACSSCAAGTHFHDCSSRLSLTLNGLALPAIILCGRGRGTQRRVSDPWIILSNKLARTRVEQWEGQSAAAELHQYKSFQCHPSATYGILFWRFGVDCTPAWDVHT